MKRLIFKILVLTWNIIPLKILFAKIIKRNRKVFPKVYRDFKYRGKFNLSIDSKTVTIYNPGYTTIENELFWNGIDKGWEKISIQVWKHFSRNSKLILDIGANTGIYSLVATTVNPECEVHSFEPVKRTYEIFKRNVEINGFKNITIHELAVSNKTGIADFFDIESESQYSASLNPEMLNNIPNRITYSVPIIMLDDFGDLKNKKVDLIKIDVEMHEVEVIKGMANIIERSRPSILVEILSDSLAAEIEFIFKDLGYLYYNINEIDEPKLVDGLSKSDYYNFLLLPKEKLQEFKTIAF